MTKLKIGDKVLFITQGLLAFCYFWIQMVIKKFSQSPLFKSYCGQKIISLIFHLKKTGVSMQEPGQNWLNIHSSIL